MSKNKPKKGKKSKVSAVDVIFPLYGGAKKIMKSIKKRMSGKPVNTKAKNTKSSKTTYNQGGSFRRPQHN
jgi:hypothetical protein